MKKKKKDYQGRLAGNPFLFAHKTKRAKHSEAFFLFFGGIFEKEKKMSGAATEEHVWLGDDRLLPAGDRVWQPDTGIEPVTPRLRVLCSAC